MAKKYTKASGQAYSTDPTPDELNQHYIGLSDQNPDVDPTLLADGIDLIHKSYPEVYWKPSLEEVVASGTLARWQKEGYDFRGAGDILLEATKRAPKSIGAAFIQMFQGQEGADVVNPDPLESWASGVDKDNEAYAQKSAEKYQNRKIFPGIELKDIAELPKNIGFSGAAAAAGLGAAAPASLLPPPVGTPLAYAAGMSAAGAAAYNMAGYQFMRTILEEYDALKMKQHGQHLTTEEQEQIKQVMSAKATEYGLWEAVPEAIGSGLGFNVLMKPLQGFLGKNLAGRVLQKLAGVYGEELATETVTQMGQKGVEQDVAKWGLGKRPEGEEPLDWASVKQWKESLKEVAPQVFLLTTGLGAATHVSTKLWRGLVNRPETRNDLEDNFQKAVATEQYMHDEVTQEVLFDLIQKGETLSAGSNNAETAAALAKLKKFYSDKYEKKDISQNVQQFKQGDYLNEGNNDTIIQNIIDQGAQPSGVESFTRRYKELESEIERRTPAFDSELEPRQEDIQRTERIAAERAEADAILAKEKEEQEQQQSFYEKLLQQSSGTEQSLLSDEELYGEPIGPGVPIYRTPKSAEESAQAIDSQLSEEERLRQSPAGGKALTQDLARKEELSNIVVDMTAMDETGKTYRIKEKADVALNDITQQKDTVKRLLECLNI